MALNAAFRWFIRKRMMNIERVRSRPVELQRHLFNRLLLEGKSTAFGAERAGEALEGGRCVGGDGVGAVAHAVGEVC